MYLRSLILRPFRLLWIWWHGLSPQRLFVASFALLIALGTAGLRLLPGLYTGERLSLLDALFTMTSAVCVTGLAVVDTATAFTFWGQLWLLIFIQLGGLGLFTLSTLIIAALGQRLSLRSEMIAGAPVEIAQRRTVGELTLAVARFTFFVELAGALVLAVQFMSDYGAVEGLWHGVFHSISAFCNAGFSTFSDSLVGYAESPLLLLPITALIILGGFGFLAFAELERWWRLRESRSRPRLSSHTFAAALVTAVLLGLGTLLYALLEWNGVLGEMGVVDRLSNAWFMSVTARTAGFNTVSYSEVGNATAFLTILLMAVGGSPGSTAGGIKTTALAVLVALSFARIRGRRYVSVHGRTVPEGTVQRTASLALVAFVLLTMAVFALSLSESAGMPAAVAHHYFLRHVFEATSALATVGLSMDTTGGLSSAGKALVVVLMFLGRVGPLAFFAAISLKSTGLPPDFRPSQEDLIVG